MTSEVSRRDGEIVVKSIRFVAVPLMFVCVVSAFAQQKHSGSFTLFSPATVGAKVLQPGIYDFHWQDGPDVVTLSISGKNTNLSVPATVSPVKGGRTEVQFHQEGGVSMMDHIETKDLLLTLKPSSSPDPTGTR